MDISSLLDIFGWQLLLLCHTLTFVLAVLPCGDRICTPKIFGVRMFAVVHTCFASSAATLLHVSNKPVVVFKKTGLAPIAPSLFCCVGDITKLQTKDIPWLCFLLNDRNHDGRITGKGC